MNNPLAKIDAFGLCSLATYSTTTISYGGQVVASSTIVASTIPLWPGPCAAPPSGCMWITAGGSGEGSQWTGMQCGNQAGLPSATCIFSGCTTQDGGDASPANAPPCQANVLNATNNQFGTDYTSANVSSTFQYSTGAPPGAGTLNLNITGSTAGVSPGYYPVNWWTYVIGYGPTLHAVSGPGGNGGLDSGQTLQFTPAQATFHIDSGFPYNPIGLFFHWLLNMTKAGGYPGC
jgi:hypothetical protein